MHLVVVEKVCYKQNIKQGLIETEQLYKAGGLLQATNDLHKRGTQLGLVPSRYITAVTQWIKPKRTRTLIGCCWERRFRELREPNRAYWSRNHARWEGGRFPILLTAAAGQTGPTAYQCNVFRTNKISLIALPHLTRILIDKDKHNKPLNNQAATFHRSLLRGAFLWW